MKLHSHGLIAAFLILASVPAQAERPNLQEAAAKIDALVEKNLKAQNLKPNAPIDDATFLRRAYLDIAGRIPTIEEAETFKGSTYEGKRERLIEDLLQSDAHVSHAYNFWADILRINSGLGTGAQQAEAAYQIWVKEAIRKNMPYDQMVRELVAARGYIWDNGAVGYYQRDRGMPLDNMSNTVRVFLGVRLECAQCHNHPFDKWTQMDYFKMAAFSYGMDANRYDSPNKTALAVYQREQTTARIREATGQEFFPMSNNMRDIDKFLADSKVQKWMKAKNFTEEQTRQMAQKAMDAYASYRHESQDMQEAVGELYRPLRYLVVSEQEKSLKLPHDYQYDDAKPFEAVTGATMFGAEIDLEKIDGSTIDAYAKWMTSKDNPTFTKVIANRMWKEAFGMGVFEPVDELTDTTAVSNPELLAYLEELMRGLNYDLRAYMQVLYNTKTWQRASNSQEVELGTPYHFAGPLLRRMSAEQIWDSVVALALPEVDSYHPRLKGQLASVEKVRQIFTSLEGRDPQEYIAMVKELGAAIGENMKKQDEVRAQMAEAREKKDDAAYAKLRQDLRDLTSASDKAVREIGYKHVGEKVDGGELMAALGISEMAMSTEETESAGKRGEKRSLRRAVMTSLPKTEMPTVPEGLNKDQARAWKSAQADEYKVYRSLVGEMARASELESPARRGHFLREFGQSDREVIENAADNASVPQALNLLNGPMVEALTNQFAVFGRRLSEAGDPDEKTRMIFQAMLTREPTARELELVKAEIAKDGDKAYEGVVWSLLNTQQFLFVQ